MKQTTRALATFVEEMARGGEKGPVVQTVRKICRVRRMDTGAPQSQEANVDRRTFLGCVGLGSLLCGCSRLPPFLGSDGVKDDKMSETWDPLAACGMDCSQCPIRKAANDSEFAEKLAEDWRRSGHPKASAGWFRCQGCHGPEPLIWTDDCGIRQCCVKDRDLKNCSQCGAFPCGRIVAFENDGNPNHRAAINRLREVRKSNPYRYRPSSL